MVSIIVLAAGESKRFGSAKQLAKINSETIIEHLLNTLKQTKAQEIIVVLGAYRDEIKKLIPKDIKIAINEQYQEGQTSSLKTGLNQISAEAEFFMVLPVDLVAVKPETIDLIIDKFKDQDYLIGIPTYKEQKGHPPIYNLKLKSKISKLKISDPLYIINREFQPQTLEIPVDDPAILFNINSPKDLEKIKNYL